MKHIYDRRYPVTSILLLVTTAVFLSMFIRFGGGYQTGAAVFYSGGVVGDIIKADSSQLWRLLTAVFVHIGLEHFVLNMITLYYLGRLAEDLFGSKAFLAIYLLSGIMGNIFVAIFTPDAVAAGASTALFGVFGTIGALRFIVQSSYIRHLSQSYTSLILVNLIFSFMPGISMAGHIGGLVAGVLLAYVFPVRGEARFMKRSYQIGASLVYLGLLAYFLGNLLNLF